MDSSEEAQLAPSMSSVSHACSSPSARGFYYLNHVASRQYGRASRASPTPRTASLVYCVHPRSPPPSPDLSLLPRQQPGPPSTSPRRPPVAAHVYVDVGRFKPHAKTSGTELDSGILFNHLHSPELHPCCLRLPELVLNLIFHSRPRLQPCLPAAACTRCFPVQARLLQRPLLRPRPSHRRARPRSPVLPRRPGRHPHALLAVSVSHAFSFVR
jgi:hypothetical protein